MPWSAQAAVAAAVCVPCADVAAPPALANGGDAEIVEAPYP